MIRAAGILVYRERRSKEDRVPEWLLLQASYGHRHWSPPKGHVDPGEDERTAAFRETAEEAGLGEAQLDVRADFAHTLRYSVNKGPKETHYLLAKLKDPKTPVRLSAEHQGFGWFTLEEAKCVLNSSRGYNDLLVEAAKSLQL